MTDVKVCLRTAKELHKHGVECYTKFCYQPKHNSTLTRADIKSKGEYYPAMTLDEGLRMLYNLNYAVCIKSESTLAWAEDEFNHIVFTAEPSEHYNHADLVANLLIKMIRNRLVTVDIINEFFDQSTRKWLKDEKITMP